MTHMTPKEMDDLDELLEAVGREITAERVRRSWTRKDLADRSGVSFRQVGKIERGERGQFVEAWKIAKALGIPLSEMTRHAEQAAEGF